MDFCNDRYAGDSPYLVALIRPSIGFVEVIFHIDHSIIQASLFADDMYGVSLSTSYPTFEMINSMEKKGIVLNDAFSVSGAFILASHLAFTMPLLLHFSLQL